jgi:small nuclear ribonucleoprotein (snRNP)-like protein
MEHKVVVHMVDGKIHKGLTRNFDPEADSFYLLPAEGGGVPVRIEMDRLKALFWVKDYVGNSDFVGRRDFEEVARSGKRVILKFRDGEEMWGTVAEVPGENAGFFFYPADRDDNNIKVYVVRSALEDMRLVP